MKSKKQTAELQISKSQNFDGCEIKNAVFCNKIFPKHFHTEWSLGTINYGIENIGFENSELQLFSKATILIPPYSVHSHFGNEDTKWSYRSIYLNEDVVKYFTGKFSFDYKILSAQPYFISYKCSLSLNDSKPHIQDIENMLFLLFSGTGIITPGSNNNIPINDILEFLKIEYSNKITLELLEQEFRVDRFKLIRTFQKQVGLTPQQYLTNLRIETAKKDLFDKKSIVEIALQNGFYDQSHFVHTFKKFVGVTPFEYKSSCKILQDSTGL